jgi:hypothetical protein
MVISLNDAQSWKKKNTSASSKILRKISIIKINPLQRRPMHSPVNQQAAPLPATEREETLSEPGEDRDHGGIWRTMHCRLCINCYGSGNWG